MLLKIDVINVYVCNLTHFIIFEIAFLEFYVVPIEKLEIILY